MRSSAVFGAALLGLTLAAPLEAQPAKPPFPQRPADPVVTQPGSPSQAGYPTEIAGKTLDQWMRDLVHADPSVREEAIRHITLFGPGAGKAVPALLKCLDDQDASPRAKAVVALRMIPIKKEEMQKVVEKLAWHMAAYPFGGEPQTIIHYEAAVTLSYFGDEAKPAVQALIRGAMNMSCYEMRLVCVAVLRRAARDTTKGPDDRAVRALLKSLKDPAWKVRLEATLSLGALGPSHDLALSEEVKGTLHRQTTYRDKTIAIWSHVSLLALDDKVTEGSVKAIAKYLKYQDTGGALTSPRSALDVRLQAAHALAVLGSKSKPVVPDLLDMLQDKEIVAVMAACAALGQIGETSSSVLNALAGLLQQKEVGLPQAAASCAALYQLGLSHSLVVPQITALLTEASQRKELDKHIKEGIERTIEELKKAQALKKDKK